MFSQPTLKTAMGCVWPKPPVSSQFTPCSSIFYYLSSTLSSICLLFCFLLFVFYSVLFYLPSTICLLLCLLLFSSTICLQQFVFNNLSSTILSSTICLLLCLLPFLSSNPWVPKLFSPRPQNNAAIDSRPQPYHGDNLCT